VTDQATEHTIIDAPLAECWAVVTDFDRYAEWAADIKSVTVLERDDQGRGSRVTFRAGAFGRSTSYTLAYDYSDAPNRLAWVQAAGDITSRLDGDYRFTPADDGGTAVTYNLLVELKVPLPGFIKQRAAARIIGTALRELKTQIET
jgi:uncharacterized membrane protein